MIANLMGSRVRLRLFAPGETLSQMCTGTVVECIPNNNATFHDSYRIMLDAPVQIDRDTIKVIHICPSGKYAFEPGKSKMDDLVWESVITTVSWQLPNGDWMSFGDKGTFAEVSLLQ